MTRNEAKDTLKCTAAIILMYITGLIIDYFYALVPPDEPLMWEWVVAPFLIGLVACFVGVSALAVTVEITHTLYTATKVVLSSSEAIDAKKKLVEELPETRIQVLREANEELKAEVTRLRAQIKRLTPPEPLKIKTGRFNDDM